MDSIQFNNIYNRHCPVGKLFVLNLANVTQLCMENRQKRGGGQEPDLQTGFSCGNQAWKMHSDG